MSEQNDKCPKLVFKATIKKKQKELNAEDIARLNFESGKLYAILTWDEAMYFPEDLNILEMSFTI